ncbi:MAG: Rne/Rng family ribonuclease [Halanaerobiales bacterium]|nr:Rne/Rng family ribonuclease [Halanaerobiales bacterium]
MRRQIIINSCIREKRAAIKENNSLIDIMFERDTYDQIVYNVYKGRVKDVLPGMQAGFVDIGLEKNAFLHISDIYPLLNKNQEKSWRNNELSIKEVIQPGQKIMVQVVKEPIGTKGAKVTCKVTLPGRYLVLMPFENRTGISRRIDDTQERNRLKKIAEDLIGDDYGLIVRTNTEGKDKEIIENDFNFLLHLWKNISRDYKNSKTPGLIYKDAELIKQIVRDHLTSEVNKIIIDDEKGYEKLNKLAETSVPGSKHKIYLYERETPIFEIYQIENEIEKLWQRKVWLESGGYIILDNTEALVSIDVNTGKYTGKKNLQDTVFKTNLEAAVEIARQLRLRDIGGIIIIDFIDMLIQQNQEDVLDTLEKELAKDKTKTAILGLTELGLVEITRKKVREEIGELFQKDCPYCNGTGLVMSETTMAMNIIRRLKAISNDDQVNAILIELHPDVAAVLIGAGGDKLDELEQELDMDIYIRGNNDYHIEKYEIISKGSKRDLKRMALPVNKGEKYEVYIEDTHLHNEDDGIARIKGYIIIIKDGGYLKENKEEVIIKEVHRTFAKAELALKD